MIKKFFKKNAPIFKNYTSQNIKEEKLISHKLLKKIIRVTNIMVNVNFRMHNIPLNQLEQIQSELISVESQVYEMDKKVECKKIVKTKMHKNTQKEYMI
jgi:hypothetical protein